jgi:hypothetical protein
MKNTCHDYCPITMFVDAELALGCQIEISLDMTQCYQMHMNYILYR